MKVKKYLAPTMKEALEKMKKDLGSEAVILGSRKISRGGLLDFLGKDMVELTATTEEGVLSQKRRSPVKEKPAGSRLSITVGDEGPMQEKQRGPFPKMTPQPGCLAQQQTSRKPVRSACCSANSRTSRPQWERWPSRSATRGCPPCRPP